MGCLLALFGAFFPRLAVFFIWLARPVYFDAVFDTFIFPLIGIIFLPFTTLMYVLMAGQIAGLDWLWLGLALVIDFAAAGSSAYGNRDRIPGYGGDVAP